MSFYSTDWEKEKLLLRITEVNEVAPPGRVLEILNLNYESLCHNQKRETAKVASFGGNSAFSSALYNPDIWNKLSMWIVNGGHCT